jgi:LytS/YehU family sensor histidine kinase
VENSVKFNPALGDAIAKVAVRASRADSRLTITVEDNGPGLPAGFKEGTGLRNVRERLEHLYGSEQALHLSNRREGGLKVTIRIPYLEPDTLPARFSRSEVEGSYA